MDFHTMNRDAQRALYQDLLLRQILIEDQQASKTLTHSDKERLAKAWDAVTSAIEQLLVLLTDDQPDCRRCSGCMYCMDQ